MIRASATGCWRYTVLRFCPTLSAARRAMNANSGEHERSYRQVKYLRVWLEEHEVLLEY
jgi:hypothetical protein